MVEAKVAAKPAVNMRNFNLNMFSFSDDPAAPVTSRFGFFQGDFQDFSYAKKFYSNLINILLLLLEDFRVRGFCNL